MNNTDNLNLKKPDYTDFADIQDINENMDVLDGAIHDTEDSTVTFTSADVADGSANAWTTVPPLASGDTHKSLLGKISQALKNLRFLWKLIGNTDISSIGNGTITNALSVLNANAATKADTLLRGTLFYGIDTDSKYFGTEYKTGIGADDIYRLQFSQKGVFGVYKKNGSSWEQEPVYSIKDAIKSITRSGTTFTATKLDGTTLSFTQQDNNTWNANGVDTAGYVAAPTASKPRYFYATGNDGSPAWRNNIYVTGATSNANGAAGLVPPPTSANYANRGFMFLRSDAGWQYLPLANNATTTAEHYALDARMGKTLNDAINAKIKFKTGSATLASIGANATTGLTINNMGISGYTLQGIVYINKTGTNADHVVLTRFFTSDSANNCSLYLKNTLSSAVSNLTVTVNCIYIKN